MVLNILRSSRRTRIYLQPLLPLLFFGFLLVSCNDSTSVNPDETPEQSLLFSEEDILTEIDHIQVNESFEYDDMIQVDGGTFAYMQSTDSTHNETGKYIVVNDIWIDKYEVSNADFKEFVSATGYITVAERPFQIINNGDTIVYAPGSLVFTPGKDIQHIDRTSLDWWTFVEGACWRHPQGPGSSIDGMADHPVVHISYFDALAYCKWSGKRLPTEAEWEYVARMSEEFDGNIWEGTFPESNIEEDGYLRSAPIGQFRANDAGCFDMSGNVWEWTGDLYNIDYYQWYADTLFNPQGPTTSFDPAEPSLKKYVIKGGSFLCHDSYCQGYLPWQRMKLDAASSLEHLGFRCVRDL